MKKLIMLFITFISLIGCGGRNQQEEKTSEWGDNIATINSKRVRDAAFFLSLCLLPLLQHY